MDDAYFIRNLSPSTIDIIRYVYKDKLFDETKAVKFTPLSNNRGAMEGNFIPLEQCSYTNKPSRIFNALTSGILLNQLCFVYLLESGVIVPSEKIGSTGRILLNNISIDCRGIISSKSERDYSFNILIDKSAKRETGKIELSLSKGRFLVRSSITIASKDLH